MGGHAIVRLEGGLVARVVEHRVQQPDHRHAVGHRDALEELERGSNLAERRRQLGNRLAEDLGALGEDGRRGLEAIRRVEAAVREVGEHRRLLEAKVGGDELVDIGIIHPEAARARLKGLLVRREVRRFAGRVRECVEQRDLGAILHQRLCE